MNSREDTFSLDNIQHFEQGHVSIKDLQASFAQSPFHVKTKWDLRETGYLTDAVLWFLKEKAPIELYSNVNNINLRNCHQLTDIGIGWLAQMVKKSSSTIVIVNLDGCVQLTHRALLALLAACSNCSVSMKCCSVIYRPMSKTCDIRGCPLSNVCKGELKSYNRGHVCIIPHEKVTTSMLEVMSTNKPVARRSLHRCKSWKNGDWDLAITEVGLQEPLFDCLVPDNCSQVLIPVDVRSSVEELKDHIIQVMARILQKESINPKYVPPKTLANNNGFFVPRRVNRILLTPDGIITSLDFISTEIGGLDSSSSEIGAVTSAVPLSRTNSFFEVECLSTQGEIGILMGCIFDMVYDDRFPMKSKQQKNPGTVDGEVLQAGFKYGFGIEGQWLSEHVPGEDCMYYKTVNGHKVEPAESFTAVCTSSFPLVCTITKEPGQAKLQILDFIQPISQPDTKKKRRYIEEGFVNNVLVDGNGVVSYVSNYSMSGTNDVGIFISRLPITSEHNKMSIKIVNAGESGKISIGIVPENYKKNKQPGWLKNSIGYHADDGFIFENGEHDDFETKHYQPIPCSTNDVMTVSVEELSSSHFQTGQQATVIFSKNGQEMYRCVFGDKDKGDLQLYMFALGLHSEVEKAQILQYKRDESKLVNDVPNMVTFGRTHFMNAYDDGVIEYRPNTDGCFGLFVSGTPLSRSLPYFEVKLLSLHANKHFGIGVCPKSYPTNNMAGWKPGSVGIHADNGQIYHNSSSGIGSSCGRLNIDDVIGCGISEEHLKTDSKFSKDGSLLPGQHVMLYFTKNGEMVHNRKFEVNSDGVFPCVTMHYDEDKGKILQYFGDQSQYSVPEQANGETQMDGSVTGGCQFIVVGTGEEKTEDKLKDLAKQLQLKTLFRSSTAMTSLWNEVEGVSSHLGDLDFQGQQTVGRLVGMRQSIENITRDENRLKFLPMGTKETYELSQLSKIIGEHMESAKEANPHCFQFGEDVLKIFDKIEAALAKEKLLSVNEIVELPVSDVDDVRNASGILKFLHSQSRLIATSIRSPDGPTDSTMIVLDIDLCVSLQKDFEDHPSNTVGTKTAALNTSTPVWLESGLKQICEKYVSGSKVDILLEILENQFGLLKVPCIRTKPEDEYQVFTHMRHLVPVPVDIENFIVPVDSKEFVVLKQVNLFPQCLPVICYPAIITLCCRYSRPVFINPRAAAFQNGAVQTLIHISSHSGMERLTVESSCFLSDVEQLSNGNKPYITNYTRNVFCVFTDCVDITLQRFKAISSVKRFVPVDFVNAATGSNHRWQNMEGAKLTVCTMCNQCCDDQKCMWSGIMGDKFRECRCKTTVGGCTDCGICRRCAVELWEIRSVLRPCAYCPPKMKSLALDPVHNNTVHVTNYNRGVDYIWLESNKSFLQVAPGPGVICTTKEERKKEEKAKKGSRRNSPVVYVNTMADTFTFKIKEMDKTQSLHIEKGHDNKRNPVILPIYNHQIAREVAVWHAAGIICYQTTKASVPVGQFIGAKALTQETRRFGFVILSEGDSCMISIGVVPRHYQHDRQPGWNPGSVAYHADDGGLFVHSGWANVHVKKCRKGDLMECEVVFSSAKDTANIIFYRNGQNMREAPLQSRVPNGGFFPAVGFHSQGECVQLVNREPWVLDPESKIEPTSVVTLNSYNDDQLLICPENEVSMTSVSSKKIPRGWMFLYNPSQHSVAYEMTAKNPSLTGEKKEILRPKTGVSFNLIAKTAVTGIKADFRWIRAEGTDTEEAIDKAFETGNPTTIKHHSIGFKITDVVTSAKAKLLTNISDGPPPNKNYYQLDVYKNLSRTGSYWIKKQDYWCHLLLEDPDHVIFCPKAASPNLPKSFKKGMHLLTTVDKKSDILASITNVTETHLTLEYIEDGTTQEIVVDRNADCIHPVGYQTLDDKLKQEASPSFDSTKKQAYYAAPYFLFNDSQRGEATGLHKPFEILQTLSNCNSDPTRLTVQEFQLKQLVLNLQTTHEVMDNTGPTKTLLPSKLDVRTLCYPEMQKITSNLAYHYLCLDLGNHHTPKSDLGIPNLISTHFLAMKGSSPVHRSNWIYAFMDCNFRWIYATQIANKLRLPSYKYLIEGAIKPLKREHMEYLLYQLLGRYAALCGILGEHYESILHQGHFAEASEKLSEGEEAISNLPPETATVISHHKCGSHMQAYSYYPRQELCNEDKQFDYSAFDLYKEHVFCFDNSGEYLDELATLSDTFCETFSNLEILELSNLWKIAELPNNISRCQNLVFLKLSSMSITSLPRDLLLLPSLMQLECTDMRVTSLDFNWPTQSTISHLNLSDLLLTSVPDELCLLSELTHLNISRNPLTSLPRNFVKLKKLRYLHISGVPWIDLEPGKKTMNRETYRIWHEANPGPTKILGRKLIDSMFRVNATSGSLNTKGISRVNSELFLSIPRIGSKNINDSRYGGFPPEIFHLGELVTLEMSFQSVTVVPKYICNLQNLIALDLSQNPLLQSLPGELGHMTSITGINLQSCPSLRTPPHEVLKRGMDSLMAYLKRLAGGYTECRRTKLMLVGLGGAGKTSLLKALMSRTKTTQEVKGQQITDGIDILSWTVKNSDGVSLTFSAWDFAGQTVYYNTHQFFLSKRAVYLLLWTTRLGFEHAGLDFWLSSISCHAPKTPIFVVGTHCDQVPKAEIPMAQMRKRYPQIVGFHFVSSTKGTGIKDLEDELMRVTMEQQYMGEKVPQVWLNLEKKILQCRADTSILEWSTVEEFGMETGIFDEKDIREAVQFLHNLGTVQYFDNDFLRSRVVINPQWIVNVMACLVSVKNTAIQNGVFKHKDIPEVWSDYDASLHSWLLQLTEEFDLTFPLPKEMTNIVPCLLPQKEPEFNWPSVEGRDGIRQTKMVYRFAYLPAGLFNRAQVRLFQFSDGKAIWKRGSLLRKNKHLAVIRQTSDSELVVTVQGPRPENVLFMIHEVFEDLIEESFKGVIYDFLIPCPDCVNTENSLEPCLFESELVRQASAFEAPFLQCRTFFHTVSMSQLLSSMPSDMKTDFDAHLQRSILALQDLHHHMFMDIAILYTAANLPKPNEQQISPFQIRDDLKKWGYSSWIADDMESVSIQDITLAVKNCKLLIALVSNEFEKDRKCHDMLLYTMNTLNQPYLVVAIRESLDWQNTDLGMRLGQELIVMLRSLSRYESKLDDLKINVQGKLSTSVKIDERPACFISYAWTNSRDAVAKKTPSKPGSVGWGDPRDLKKYLEKNGVSCWLDVERNIHENKSFGTLTQNINNGLKHCEVMLACVSAEYVESKNCMMELRFGVFNLNKPLVVAIVGSGEGWQESEVGMIMQRAKASKVYFHKKSETAETTLMSLIHDKMPLKSHKEKRNEAVREQAEITRKMRTQEVTSSFQEEYELIQRKFMRRIMNVVATGVTKKMPRLMVFDFTAHDQEMKIEAPVEESPMRSSSSMSSWSRKQRPLTAGRRIAEIKNAIKVKNEFELEDKDLCIKALCEHEEGWHLCERSLPLTSIAEVRDLLTNTAPFLSRIYAILKQSSMQLNCLTSKHSESFLSWLDEECTQSTTLDFLEAYSLFQDTVGRQHGAEEFCSQLDRCRLPSGKITWLCQEHQQGSRITRLNLETASATEQETLISEEDLLLKDLIEKSSAYQRQKAEKPLLSQIKPPDMTIVQQRMSNISQSVVQAAIEELKDEENNKPGEISYPPIYKVASSSQKHRRRLKKTTAKSEPQKIDDVGLVDPQPADGTSSANPIDNNAPSTSQDSVDSKRNAGRRFKAAQDVALLTTHAANAVQREKSKACVLQ